MDTFFNNLPVTKFAIQLFQKLNSVLKSQIHFNFQCITALYTVGGFPKYTNIFYWISFGFNWLSLTTFKLRVMLLQLRMAVVAEHFTWDFGIFDQIEFQLFQSVASDSWGWCGGEAQLSWNGRRRRADQVFVCL